MDNSKTNVLKLSMFSTLKGNVLIHDIYNNEVACDENVKTIFNKLLRKPSMVRNDLIGEDKKLVSTVSLLEEKKHLVADELDEEALYYPNNVCIETIETCNAKCIYCPQSVSRKGNNKIMSLEDYSVILSRLKQYTPQWVSFSHYNEPLLDPYFKTRVEMLKKADIPLFLFTNATKLNEEITEFLCNQKLYGCIFNFPSIVESEWTEMLSVSSKLFERTKKNIEYFVSNYTGELQELAILVNGITHDQDKRVESIREQFSKFGNVDVLKWDSDSRAGSIENEHIIERPISNREYFKGCDQIAQYLNVAYNGKVFLCCQDYNQKVEIGNLIESDIETIMQSDTAKEVRGEIYGTRPMKKNFVCKSCTHLRIWKISQ